MELQRKNNDIVPFRARMENARDYTIDKKTGRVVQRNVFGRGFQTGIGATGRLLNNLLGGTSMKDREIATAVEAGNVPTRRELRSQQNTIPTQAVSQTPTPEVTPYQPYDTGSYTSDFSQMQPVGNQYQQTANTDIQSKFGSQFGSTDDLMVQRDKLNQLRERAIAGESISDSEIAGIMGIQDTYQMDPNQRKALRAAAADYFDRPIALLDNHIAQQEKMQQAQSAQGSGLLGALPNAIRDDVWKIRTEFTNDPVVKEYSTLAPSYTFLANLPENVDNSTAQAALISFTKALDPTSVVREGELQLTTLYASNPSLANQLKLQYNRLANGQVVPSQAIKQVVGAFNQRFSAIEQNYQQRLGDRSSAMQALYGIDPQTASMILGNAAPVRQQSQQQTKQVGGTTWYDNGDGTWSDSPKVSRATGSPVKSLPEAMSRIARNESDGSGGYAALGPVLTSGQYKGQRALGKYQIMEGNIPSWSKEALGQSITPQQFYQSPQLQDRIAAYKLNQYYQKYGDWGHAASAWFTGGPLTAKSAGKKDVFGTSAMDYVNKFNGLA